MLRGVQPFESLAWQTASTMMTINPRTGRRQSMQALATTAIGCLIDAKGSETVLESVLLAILQS